MDSFRDSEESGFENPLDKKLVQSVENTPSRTAMRAKLIKAVTHMKKNKDSQIEGERFSSFDIQEEKQHAASMINPLGAICQLEVLESGVIR